MKVKFSNSKKNGCHVEMTGVDAEADPFIFTISQEYSNSNLFYFTPNQNYILLNFSDLVALNKVLDKLIKRSYIQ